MNGGYESSEKFYKWGTVKKIDKATRNFNVS